MIMLKNLRLKHTVTLVMAVFLYGLLSAQTTVKGTVYDAETKETLFGASIIIKGTNTGSQSSFDGTFKFVTTITGDVTISVSYIGYLPQTFSVNLSSGEKDMGKIYLESDAIGMEQLNVIANVAVDRKTPVAVSSISAAYIEQQGGSLEVPELLNNTPGSYATNGGGGFGDSEIRVRGFDQRNIAIMVNGIPVNDMENGWVYWSNWAGLGDAMRTMQIQRGLGASKLAINSVGGTINMVTKTTDVKAGGSIASSVTSFGNRKLLVSLSTGKTADGWAITFVGSRTQGEGWADQTWVDAWSYYLSVSKEWKKNILSLTVIGAPQEHGQRLFTVGEQTVEDYGYKYNQHWGDYQGQVLMERQNYYHKPQIALNDYWTISDRTNLSVSAYASFGRGGGTGTFDNREVPDLGRVRMRRDTRGQIDWNYWAEVNANHTDTAFMDNGTYTANGNLLETGTNDTLAIGGYQTSKNILRNSVNNHQWFGMLATLNHRLTESFNLLVGIDGRTYQGIHYREVRNLLGGDIFIQSFSNAVDGDAGRSQIAKVGDKIAYDNKGLVSYMGAFGQLEYSEDKLSAFIATTLSNTWYGKIDYYNYVNPDDQKSETVTAFGFNVKAGANYNLNEFNNIFVNAGFYSRAPYWDFVFVNTNANSLTPVNDILNEKITAFELGYGLRKSWISFNAGAYYTIWSDRSITDGFVDPVTLDEFTAPVLGLKATHMGLEFDLEIKATNWLSFMGAASIGDWKWDNNVSATIFNDFGTAIDTVEIYAENLPVADQPQTLLVGGVNFQILPSLFANFTYRQNYRLYRGFDVIEVTEPGYEAEQLDNYGIMDFHTGFNFEIAGLESYAGMDIYNVFDTFAKQEGDSFGYYYTLGRRFNFSLRISF